MNRGFIESLIHKWLEVILPLIQDDCFHTTSMVEVPTQECHPAQRRIIQHHFQKEEKEKERKERCIVRQLK